jgi:predicted ATPase
LNRLTATRNTSVNIEDPSQLFPALRGLWNHYNARAEYQTALTLGEQLLTLAHQAQDSGMLLAAYRALGATLFYLGETTLAYTHFAQGLTLYAPQQHRASVFRYGDDAGVICHSFAARALWYLGYPDQGLAQNDEAVTLAQQMAHPLSLSFVLSNAAQFHQLRREERAAQAHAKAAMSLAMEQGFALWVARGALLRGWALVQQGQAQEGIAQMHQGLRAYRATGGEATRPYYLTLLAEAQGSMGQPAEGLLTLAEALLLADKTGERWYEPERYRLKGELLLQQSSSNQTEAELCFHQAITIAQNQQAKSLELRAATSLARLWQQQGKREEAYGLLASVYNWFTEGFDTADLQDAKALLDELA